VRKTKKRQHSPPCGEFIYDKMNFGIMNAGATFQRAMDIDFVGGKYKFMAIYLYYITIFSKPDEEHLQHLEKVFKKCGRY
jgi:hypothetical protein